MMDFLVQKAFAQGLIGPDSTGGTGGLIGPDSAAAGSTFNKLLNSILSNVVTPLVYLIMAVALIYFLWGVVMFIQNADNADKREDGYKHMIWGIIGLFIMVSARAIVSVIFSTISK